MPHYGFSLHFPLVFSNTEHFPPMHLLAVTASHDFDTELPWPQWDGLEAVTQG